MEQEGLTGKIIGAAIFYVTLRSYLRATGKSVGLLLNFAALTIQPKRIGPDLPVRA